MRITELGKFFLGSKTNDGYSWDRSPCTNPAKYLGYGAAIVTAHCIGTNPLQDHAEAWAEGGNYTVIDPLTLPTQFENIEKHKNCLFDPKTTLKTVLMRHKVNPELLIAFGSGDSFKTECASDSFHESHKKQVAHVHANLLGSVPEVYQLAEKVVLEILSSEDFASYIPAVTGQCYGGALAQYVGLKIGIPAVVFNSIPIGPGLQYEIGSEKLKEASTLVHHLSVDGDYTSNNNSYHSASIDKIVSMLGIRTPGSFGIRETIPSAFSNPHETHAFIMGSIGKATGLGNPRNGLELQQALEKSSIRGFGS